MENPYVEVLPLKAGFHQRRSRSQRRNRKCRAYDLVKKGYDSVAYVPLMIQ